MLVIGHRGACGARPEHTAGSYRLAAAMGADLIEPDLVATADHVLVARHEPAIGATTDVAQRPEFAGRRTTKVIDGMTFADDWFTEDFTLAELKTLRARERLPELRPQNTAYDGREPILTFAEVLALRDELVAEHARPIGVVPELKHSSYFRGLGVPLEEPFADAVRGREATVVVQSFEIGNLLVLAAHAPDVRRMQLVGPPDGGPADAVLSYAEMTTPAGLHEIARYAQIVSPPKQSVVPRDADERSLAPTSLVDDAHAAGLELVAFTFRAENAFLPRELRSGDDPAAAGDLAAEIAQFAEVGVDGIFTDNPDIARGVLSGRP